MAANPSLYREMSQPFISVEKANEAVQAFFEDLGELRKKHHLQDVYAIVRVNVAYEQGEGSVMTSCHYGDTLACELMTAWALGREQADRQERIAKVMAEAMKAVEGPKKRK